MSSVRIQKVAGLIRHELSEILRDDVDEVRQALVTITSVWLSADMRLARVHVSVFPETADRQAILAAMRRARGRLKRDLGRALRLRHVPDLEFLLDTSLEQGARIEEILKADAAREEDQAAPTEHEPE